MRLSPVDVFVDREKLYYISRLVAFDFKRGSRYLKIGIISV